MYQMHMNQLPMFFLFFFLLFFFFMYIGCVDYCWKLIYTHFIPFLYFYFFLFLFAILNIVTFWRKRYCCFMIYENRVVIFIFIMLNVRVKQEEKFVFFLQFFYFLLPRISKNQIQIIFFFFLQHSFFYFFCDSLVNYSLVGFIGFYIVTFLLEFDII